MLGSIWHIGCDRLHKQLSALARMQEEVYYVAIPYCARYSPVRKSWVCRQLELASNLYPGLPDCEHQKPNNTCNTCSSLHYHPPSSTIRLRESRLLAMPYSISGRRHYVNSLYLQRSACLDIYLCKCLSLDISGASFDTNISAIVGVEIRPSTESPRTH